MLIENEFAVGQPIEKVWRFFDDVPKVAACLPGAELTEDLGEEAYEGRVSVRMGPVALKFGGMAKIASRDDAAKRIVVDAAGADEKGRGQASMTVTATLTSAGGVTRVHVTQDLQVSGAAAQYGRGMIADVTAVLMRDFAANLQNGIDRAERGEEVTGATPARGFSIGLQATLMALRRVFRRFFLPYPSSPA
ncbi:SRPBCC family protein [Amycolatopsis sp. NPDC049252]|uniref:SRPBCC family protein n=1 Tax=Amycolatopsis sp. NPDC049252 TaxID=3363933 RepID=UPI0037200D6C